MDDVAEDEGVVDFGVLALELRGKEGGAGTGEGLHDLGRRYQDVGLHYYHICFVVDRWYWPILYQVVI